MAREARVAAQRHDARAVTIFDVVSDDGDPWLVLEYMPSRRSIEELLADPRVQEAYLGEGVGS